MHCILLRLWVSYMVKEGTSRDRALYLSASLLQSRKGQEPRCLWLILWSGEVPAWTQRPRMAFRWWRSRSQRPREGVGLRSELISTTLLKMSMRWSTPFPSVLSKNGGSKVECLLRSSQRMPWCKGRMMTVFKCRSLLSFVVLCAFMLWSADYLSLLVMLSCSLVLSSIGSVWPSMGLPFILLSYLVL